MHMILGKKQIILSCLVLALGMAVYLNWQFAQADSQLDVSGVFSQGEEQTDKNYGDAQLVGKNQGDTSDPSATTADGYFAKARMDRSQARDTTLEELKDMLSKSDLTNKQKEDLAAQVSQLTQCTETETRVENQIIAKGFEDCMAYISGENISIVVQCKDGLNQALVAQIKNIVLNETNLKAENISISEAK